MPEDCSAQDQPTPVANVDHFGGDSSIPEKRKSVQVTSGTCPTINWTFNDPSGNVIDLTNCISGASPAGTVKFRLTDALANDGAQSKAAIAATVVSQSAGTVRVELTEAETCNPGIFLAEFAVVADDDCIKLTNQFYFVVEGGLFGSGSLTGPPSVAEIRLFLRDYRQENELLDTYDFDLSEISLATYMPVQYWNESLPPINAKYSSRSFPYRYHWMMAICAHLYSIAGEHYRRNRLPYSAGGMQINDKDKANEYEQKSAQLMQEFKSFVREKKVSLNLEAAWGEVGSSYSGNTVI